MLCTSDSNTTWLTSLELYKGERHHISCKLGASSHSLPMTPHPPLKTDLKAHTSAGFYMISYDSMQGQIGPWGITFSCGCKNVRHSPTGGFHRESLWLAATSLSMRMCTVMPWWLCLNIVAKVVPRFSCNKVGFQVIDFILGVRWVLEGEKELCIFFLK